ncbi:MAG: ATP-binding protein [Dehalococcoidales bacterium]|nr:ATP-binding protein [Dehalococcoidales bacterium]
MKINNNLQRIQQLRWRGYILSIVLVTLVSWVKWIAQPNIIPANVTSLYIVAIAIVSIYFGYAHSIFCSIISVLTYNSLFASPEIGQSLKFLDLYIPFIFVVIGVVITYLSSHLRKKTVEALREVKKRKQHEAELILYRDQLERIVEERTKELQSINVALNDEIKVRKQAETSLIESMADKERLTRLVVHELKTPLTPILAASELLSEQVSEGPLYRLSKSIEKGARTISKRVDNILDVMKGEMGVMALNRRETNLVALLSSITDDTKPLATVKNIQFTCQLPVSEIKGWVDAERVRQVTVNLLDNAFKFTPENGKITLMARENDNALIVEVKDTGPGMSIEEQKLLFTPYHHLKSENPHGKGLGLGLSLCKTLIELHGGRIWVESSKGNGCNFCFSIPLHSEKLS